MGPEILAKLDALPMKLEVLKGKLFWDDAERVRLLAALMEHVGLDQVLQVARFAAALDDEVGGPPSLHDLEGSFGIPGQAVSDRDMNPDIADPGGSMPIGGASADSSRRTWNYRVMRFESDGQLYFAIHEVYYAGEKPTAYTVRPATVGWDGDEGMGAAHSTLARMHEALTKPVLTPADFDEHPQDVDDEMRDWDNMTPVGRERFWEPAANRYPFKTILELKRLSRGKAARGKAGRVAKLSRLKASIRKGTG